MGFLKNKALKLLVGGGFLLILFGTAPLVVRVILAGESLFDDTPSPEEVCLHTEQDLGLKLKVDCVEWVEAREIFVVSLYPQMLTCMNEAQTEEAWLLCEDLEHLKTWRD